MVTLVFEAVVMHQFEFPDGWIWAGKNLHKNLANILKNLSSLWSQNNESL